MEKDTLPLIYKYDLCKLYVLHAFIYVRRENSRHGQDGGLDIVQHLCRTSTVRQEGNTA